MEDRERLLKANSPADTDFLHTEPEQNYVTKSPGMLVRFAGGENIHMNRATRRKNGLYGNRLRVVRGPR